MGSVDELDIVIDLCESAGTSIPARILA